MAATTSSGAAGGGGGSKRGALTEAQGVAIIGMPGSGKSTLAQQLAVAAGFETISPGNDIRRLCVEDSPLGDVVRAVQQSGSEEQLNELNARLAHQAITRMSPEASGFAIDGFPVTRGAIETFDRQARGYTHGLDAIKVVFFLDVDDEVAVERLTGRLVHIKSGRVYHRDHAPPEVAGLDDVTGEPLTDRAEDKEERVRRRTAFYHARLGEVRDFFEERGIEVVSIDTSALSTEDMCEEAYEALVTKGLVNTRLSVKLVSTGRVIKVDVNEVLAQFMTKVAREGRLPWYRVDFTCEGRAFPLATRTFTALGLTHESEVELIYNDSLPPRFAIPPAFVDARSPGPSTSDGTNDFAGLERLTKAVALKRLSKDLQAVMQMAAVEAVVPFVDATSGEACLEMWRVVVRGPGGSPYQGGYYVLVVEYPPTYPTHPPKVAFQTPVVHPTIGRASPYGEEIAGSLFTTAFTPWRPVMGVRDIVKHVRDILTAPDEELVEAISFDNAPAMADLQKTAQLYQTDRVRFEEKAAKSAAVMASPSVLANLADPVVAVVGDPTDKYIAIRDELLEAVAAHAAKISAEHEADDALAHKLYTCNICFCDYAISDIFVLDECHHRFCHACISATFASRIEDGDVFNLMCPQCNRVVSYAEVKQVCSAEDMDKFHRFSLTQALTGMDDVKWCPRPGCGNAIIYDPDVSPMFVCPSPSCGFSGCADCGTEWHAGATCEAYRQWKQENNDSERLFASWAADHTKPCPRCHVKTEKNGGCNHMTCRNCNHQYCWLCFARCFSEDNHFSTSSCNQFN